MQPDARKEVKHRIRNSVAFISVTPMTRIKTAKRAKKQPATTEQDECFVIMPFGGYFDGYYENIYKPAIESAGLICRRADELYRPSAITNDIWALTKSAKLVLADLSGRNPNVFYELGLAHAIAKPAIMVTHSLDDVPSDLRSLRVLIYDKNRQNWGSALKAEIKLAIKEVLASPVKAVLPTFLTVDDSHKPSVTSTEKELISLRQDVDALRRDLAGKPRPGEDLYMQALRRAAGDLSAFSSPEFLPTLTAVNLTHFAKLAHGQMTSAIPMPSSGANSPPDPKTPS